MQAGGVLLSWLVVDSPQDLKNSPGKIFLVHHPEAWLEPVASCDAWKLFWLCLQVIQTAGFGLQGCKNKNKVGEAGFQPQGIPHPHDIVIAHENV